MENHETITLADILGPFHFFVILATLALFFLVAITGLLKRIKGSSVSAYWRLSFMLGIAVYFWGQMWADINLAKMNNMQAIPNTGFDPAIIPTALSEIHGVRMIYSGLAFSYVALAIGLAVIGHIGNRRRKAETAAEQPATAPQAKLK